MSNKTSVIMREWSVSNNGQFFYLNGVAIGHPKLGTQFVHTSPIIHVDVENKIIETRNTLYMLEEPCSSLSQTLTSNDLNEIDAIDVIENPEHALDIIIKHKKQIEQNMLDLFDGDVDRLNEVLRSFF